MIIILLNRVIYVPVNVAVVVNWSGEAFIVVLGNVIVEVFLC